MLRKWTRSRKRDDMKARTRPNNRIKISNARSSLPFPAYHKIAELMLILHPDPFLHCMFVFQWNMISRLVNVRGLMFNRIGWNNDYLYVSHSHIKADQDGKNCLEMIIRANRYDPFICPVTSLAILLQLYMLWPRCKYGLPRRDKKYTLQRCPRRISEAR